MLVNGCFIYPQLGVVAADDVLPLLIALAPLVRFRQAAMFRFGALLFVPETVNKFPVWDMEAL